MLISRSACLRSSASAENAAANLQRNHVRVLTLGMRPCPIFSLQFGSLLFTTTSLSSEVQSVLHTLPLLRIVNDGAELIGLLVVVLLHSVERLDKVARDILYWLEARVQNGKAQPFH